MNQNRNNNRRRGRGNNRGQGGGNQGNRIDSRARGNAPQLLEKYRKMAHDASLNGDRVQTEYYLQFADHYFRVVADSRAQRDEQRPRNGQGREFGEGREPSQEYDYEDGEDIGEAGGPAPSYQTRREREEQEQSRAQEGEPVVEGERADESGEERNPFVREGRNRRPRERGPRRADGPHANGAETNGMAIAPAEATFDPAVLPPAIGGDAEQPPRPRRGRRPRPDDEGEALEAVS